MANFDRVADIYDATRRMPTEEMTKIIDSLTHLLSDCRTILDAGVGTGRYAIELSQRGYSVIGLDISQKMLAIARQKGMKDLLIGDISGKIPFRDGYFDASLVVHVLHLVNDWKLVVHELARVADKYVVTVFNEVDALKPRDRYLALRNHFGFPLGRDDTAWKVALKAASKIVLVQDQQEEINGDDSILHLGNRRSSVTWDVPDEIHEKIMAQLKRELQGKKYETRALTKIAVWNSSNLVNI